MEEACNFMCFFLSKLALIIKTVTLGAPTRVPLRCYHCLCWNIVIYCNIVSIEMSFPFSCHLTHWWHPKSILGIWWRKWQMNYSPGHYRLAMDFSRWCWVSCLELSETSSDYFFWWGGYALGLGCKAFMFFDRIYSFMKKKKKNLNLLRTSNLLFYEIFYLLKSDQRATMLVMMTINGCDIGRHWRVLVLKDGEGWAVVGFEKQTY